MQLRFASFAVINLRRDLHPRECALAGRAQKGRREIPAALLHDDFNVTQCAAAISAPRPVSERTFCAANSARSFFALSLPSVTDTT